MDFSRGSMYNVGDKRRIWRRQKESFTVKKRLSEMTLEELWQLFPIRLEPHRDEWAAYYAEAAAMLCERLDSRDVVRISHIGSTAVGGIMAKPIVDILVEIAPGSDMNRIAGEIESLGFLKMSESDGRASFNLGYTENGFAEKVYHLHLRFAGDNDELYFRDRLIENADVAKEYEALKISLANRFEHDRDAYTRAKTEFVGYHTALAKSLFPGRYDRPMF